MKKVLVLIAVLALVAPVAQAHCGACGVGDDHSAVDKAKAKTGEMKDKKMGETMDKTKKQMSIVETAASSEDFTILTQAVEAAGLRTALSGEGPFTVFAPTDKAFKDLPEGVLESLLKDKDKLASILTYHVVKGNVTAEKVAGLDRAETMNGQDLKIMKHKEGVMINDASVVTTDIMCSNGVIHVVDKVIIPETQG